MSETKICPKCGYPDIYLGATKVECGYEPTCENFSERQANEIQKKLSKNFPSTTNIEDQLELDWTPDEDDTQPYGIPLCDGAD